MRNSYFYTMNTVGLIPSPSPFAQLVDKLRNKSEAELKMLYVQFFKDELSEEWKQITAPADFSGVSEEEMILQIQQSRYSG